MKVARPVVPHWNRRVLLPTLLREFSLNKQRPFDESRGGQRLDETIAAVAGRGCRVIQLTGHGVAVSGEPGNRIPSRLDRHPGTTMSRSEPGFGCNVARAVGPGNRLGLRPEKTLSAHDRDASWNFRAISRGACDCRAVAGKPRPFLEWSHAGFRMAP